AEKIRHHRGRQGNASFRRPTTTIGHCARGPEKCAYSPARRSHFCTRFRIGKTNSNGAANARRRQDRGRNCPPALHHFVFRSDHRHGERPCERNRHPCRITSQVGLLSTPL